MRVELHTHNYFSMQTKVLYDGLDSPADMVNHAAELGLDAIVITDHNTMDGYERVKKFAKKASILVIPGEEISCAQGHLIAVGIQEFIKPKLSVLETVDNIHAQGGVAIAPHPFDVTKDGLREFSIHCDAIEVFSAINVDRISNLVAKKFAKKHHMPGVASSDAHFQQMLGHGVTDVAGDDVDGIINAIKKGKVSLPKSNSYLPVELMTYWAVERLKKSYDYTMEYIDANYHGPKKVLSKRMLRLVNRSPGNIDRIFKCMGYVSLGGAIAASAARNVV